VTSGTVPTSSTGNFARVDDACSRITKSISDAYFCRLIMIGDDETLSNVSRFRDAPQVLITKTTDKDVSINETGRIVDYFTPGYHTARQKFSAFVSLEEGLKTTMYSDQRIIAVKSMGRTQAGLLLPRGGDTWKALPSEFPLNYDSIKQNRAL